MSRRMPKRRLAQQHASLCRMRPPRMLLLPPAAHSTTKCSLAAFLGRANDIAMQANRKTLSATDVIAAMQEIEFGSFVESLNETLEGLGWIFSKWGCAGAISLYPPSPSLCPLYITGVFKLTTSFLVISFASLPGVKRETKEKKERKDKEKQERLAAQETGETAAADDSIMDIEEPVVDTSTAAQSFADTTENGVVSATDSNPPAEETTGVETAATEDAMLEAAVTNDITLDASTVMDTSTDE